MGCSLYSVWPTELCTTEIMIKKKELVENAIFSIKLREELYTIAQLRFNHRLECFDITKKDDSWEGVDLNHIDPIFCIVVAEDRLLKLFHTNQSDVIHPNLRPIPQKVLSYGGINRKAFQVDLVEMDECYSSVDNHLTVVVKDVNVNEHLDIIYQYELAGMMGDPEKIRNRLLRYFDTGVNWDEQKEVFFSNIVVPPPNYRVKH